MGGKQSRIEASDVETEIHSQHSQENGEPAVTITLTPALVAQLQGAPEPTSAANAAAAAPAALTKELEAEHKKQLQQAYLKGAADFRKEWEAKHKEQTQANSTAKQAQLATEAERLADAKVQQVVAEINKKTYRAPLRDVECSTAREATLACYRDKQSDVLQCRDVADAFLRCAQQTTDKFVKEK